MPEPTVDYSGAAAVEMAERMEAFGNEALAVVVDLFDRVKADIHKHWSDKKKREKVLPLFQLLEQLREKEDSDLDEGLKKAPRDLREGRTREDWAGAQAVLLQALIATSEPLVGVRSTLTTLSAATCAHMAHAEHKLVDHAATVFANIMGEKLKRDG